MHRTSNRYPYGSPYRQGERQGERIGAPDDSVYPFHVTGKHSIRSYHLTYRFRCPAHHPHALALAFIFNSALESKGLIDVVVTMRELLDANRRNLDAVALSSDDGGGDENEDEGRADRTESKAASAARKSRGNSAMAA